MKRRYPRFILLAVWALGVLLLLRRGEAPSPEEQVRQVILTGKAGLEKRDLRQCMSIISPHYDDGEFRRVDVLRAAHAVFREVEAIQVTITDLAIAVAEEQTAKATMNVLIRATSYGQTRDYRTPVTIQLQRERRGWKVISVTDWVDITA